MTSLSYMRQTGIFDPAKNPHASATFVGVGGIGSFAAFATAKLGIPNLTLIDPDVVEEHNVPCQMFRMADAFDEDGADELKVEAMKAQILDTNPDANVTAYMARAEEDGFAGPDHAPLLKPDRLTGLVVSGLDSMKARSDLWHANVRLNPLVPMYIDGRLDGQTIVIYAVNPCNMEDVEQYEATLASDDEVPAGMCTERSIIDVGFMVGSLISRMVRLHYTDQPLDKITVVNQATLDVAKGGWLV